MEKTILSRIRTSVAPHRRLVGHTNCLRTLTRSICSTPSNRQSAAASSSSSEHVAKSEHKPLTRKQKDFLDRLIRVDQAGELAADYIYAGQYFVLKNGKFGPVIRHMWEQEIHHHKTFDNLQTERRVRPSLFTPVWKAAALTLGASTAFLSKEAAMACTVAVETVIGGHYNNQLREIINYEKSPEIIKLTNTVKEFRDDELEHLDTAIENDAEKAVPYRILTEVIKNGCRLAIETAERF